MVGPLSSGTQTITSIDVHAEGEAGRILLGAHLLVRGTTWPARREAFAGQCGDDRRPRL
jgi:proline racemase